MKKNFFPSLCSALIFLSVIGFFALPCFASIMMISGSSSPNATFDMTPLPSNPNLPGFTFSQTNLNTAYTNVFGGNSPNPLPNASWAESETTAVLLLDNGKTVDTFQDFKFHITGDYWNIETNINFNPATAIIVDPNDHVTLSGYIQHFGKLSTNNIPHFGDIAEGPKINYSVDVNAGDKKERDAFGPAAAAGQGAAAEHLDIGHVDVEQSALFARVESKTFVFDVIDDISRWTGVVAATHIDPFEPSVPEPSTIFLFGAGMGGLLFMKKKRNIFQSKHF